MPGKPGSGGPVPKRSEDKAGHRTKAELNQITKANGAAEVEVPKPRRDWHPITKAWYKSLAESGQSQFYEPSDWWTAQYVAEAMSRSLKSQNGLISGQLFQAIMSASTELMVTEGARRRLRVELQRPDRDQGAESDGGGEVTLLDDYRDLYG